MISPVPAVRNEKERMQSLQCRLEEFRTEDTEGTEARKEFLVKEIINELLVRDLSVTQSLSSVSSVRALPPSDIFPSNPAAQLQRLGCNI
jgi:hypothetical protein